MVWSEDVGGVFRKEDGCPLTTGGNDELGMDGWLRVEGRMKKSDGSPPTTCGDDGGVGDGDDFLLAPKLILELAQINGKGSDRSRDTAPHSTAGLIIGALQ